MPLLRECKCGKKAYDIEDLELFVKSKECNHGRRNQCKACGSKASRKSMGYKEPKKSAPKGTYTTTKGQSIWARYGISEQEHKKLLNSVENKCQICKKDTDLVVDHCHETRKIRGILCRSCNLLLGKIRKCPELEKNACEYLNNREYLKRKPTCK
jgi:hypothetical protein